MPTKKATTTKTFTPKKVTTKAVAKKETKAPAKKSKATMKKALVYANENNSFWVADGQVLNSLVTLHDALVDMHKDIYAHHVTNDKNDFATWVETVLDDAVCAKSLRGAKTPVAAKTVIVRSLKLYTL